MKKTTSGRLPRAGRREPPMVAAPGAQAEEIEELRRRLAEADDALRAIREGEVDAVIVSGIKGERIFSLSESENIYRLMVETMSEAGLAVTPDGTILFSNNCLRTMLRSPLEQVVGKPLARFVSPHSRKRLNALLAKTRVAPAEARLVLVASDGTAIPVHAWANLLDRPDGPVICLVGVDLTALKTSKEMIQHLQEQGKILAVSEEKYRLLFENMTEGFALYELLYDERGQPADWRILEVNGAYSTHTGMNRNKVQGRKASELFPEAISEYLPRFARVVATQTAVEFESYNLFVERHQHVFTFPAGKNRFASTIMDITERKRAELIINRSHEELEEQVRQRAEEIKKKEDFVQRAQRLDALGTLAGGIAHDFNNILSTIMMNVEMVLFDAPEQARQQGPLPLVLQAVQRGRELTKQIITFSRQKELDLKPIRVASIITDTLKMLRSTLPASIEIHEDVEEKNDFVRADSSQIQQILLNLCLNAAHALQEQGGLLEVGLKAVEIDAPLVAMHNELRPGPYVRFVVRDNGCGMLPEVMEHAFDPFFTTKAPGKGSGLGLSVVHGIVQSYRGGIIVESAPGRGSTFIVYLPLAPAEREPASSKLETVSGAAERILLVEDEAIQLQTFSKLLARLGYAVTAIGESGPALDAFKAKPHDFDLIITDQTMPKMSGVELAEAALRIRPGTPIILTTGFSEVIDREKAKTVGIREFVYKPFSLQEISATIRRVLDGRNAAPAERARPQEPKKT